MPMTREEAINELIKRGLSPTGQPLTEDQQSAITELRRRGISPAEIFKPIDTTTIQQQAITQAVKPLLQTAGGMAPIVDPLKIMQMPPLRQALERIGGRILASPAFLQQHPTAAPQIRGFAQGFANVPIGLAQAFGGKAPLLKLPGAEYGGLGKFLGGLASTVPLFVAPEAGAGAALARAGIARATPYLGRMLPAIRGAVGGVLPGMALNPQQAAKGAALGAILGSGSPLVPGLFNKIFGRNTSKHLTAAALDEISGGLHSSIPKTALEMNATSVANDLRGLHGNLLNDYKQQIGPIMQQYGESNINPDLFTDFIKDTQKIGNSDVNSSLKTFLKEPNLNNAHNLQSVLGHDIGTFSPANREEYKQLARLRLARTALKNDINTNLNDIEPSGVLTNAYNTSSDFFKNNLAPFTKNKTLFEITKGTIKNPVGKLTKIFERPDEGMQSIINKVSPDFKNRVLYDDLGKIQKTIKSQTFVNHVDTLDQRGLATHFLSDDLGNARDAVARAIAHEKGLLHKVIRGGLIRIPQWLIAGTAFTVGMPEIAKFLGEGQ